MLLPCPRCLGASMEEIEVGKTLIDRCVVCGGLWFDQGEIGELTDGGAQIRELEQQISDDASTLRCPRCIGTDLRRGPLDDKSGDALFRCPSCMGSWMDRGVLRIVEDEGIVVAVSRRMKLLEL